MTHRVVVLALDRVVPFDLGIAARVFGEARDLLGRPLYEVLTCSIGGALVRTSADYALQVEHDERTLAAADTVVVATQEPTGPLLESGKSVPEVAAALALVRPDARLVSICTSAFVLAAAGLLDGLAATTHWALTQDFTRLFPQVDLHPDVLFVDSGRILTSAGGAAGIDMCLYLIRRDHGAEVANNAARHCVVAPWRAGEQAQFIERPMPPEATTATTASTRLWALNQLEKPLSLDVLAYHARMSARTFTRRFRSEVGMSPTQWLIQSRLDRARVLLETSDLSVDLVARHCGFASATLLRQHFRALLEISPQTYRRSFQTATRGRPQLVDPA